MSARPVTSTPDVSPSALDALSRSDPRRASGLEAAVLCVLHGGRSSEREVSTVSGAEILQALRTPTGPEDRRGPVRVLGTEILPNGRWRVGGRELTPGEALLALSDVDVFFSALHGGEGESGAIQGLFATSDRAFTGSGVAACAVALDKVFGRELLAARGTRVAPGRVVTRAEWEGDGARLCAELETWQVPGWAVKPRAGGSSVGCSIVRAGEPWDDAFAVTFAWEEEALVEALVEGVELTGGVLATPDAGREALPVVEIRPHPGRFFDYQEKYAAGGALELCPPESVSAAVTRRVQALSLLAHETLRCEGYSRSDFILPEGEDEPVFLELNTLPGMTPRSLLPRAAAAAGVDYRTLCLWIAADAHRRAKGRRP